MIYVDESFQGSETILCAVVVKEDKCKKIVRKVRDLLNKDKLYKKSELKLNFIKMNYNKEKIESISKKIVSLTQQVLYTKHKCSQHSREFYNLYHRFLTKLKSLFPNEIIVVDNFSGHSKVQNYKDYQWKNSAQQSGLQLADISIYSYAISKDILHSHIK